MRSEKAPANLAAVPLALLCSKSSGWDRRLFAAPCLNVTSSSRLAFAISHGKALLPARGWILRSLGYVPEMKMQPFVAYAEGKHIAKRLGVAEMLK